MDKTITLAAFIPIEKLETFVAFLGTEYGITRNKLFIYDIVSDITRVIVTFRITTNTDTRINIKEIYPTTIIVHKRGDAFYTINALNQLIKNDFGEGIDTKSVKIDWSNYQNKFILLNDTKLSILDIKRIF